MKCGKNHTTLIGGIPLTSDWLIYLDITQCIAPATRAWVVWDRGKYLLTRFVRHSEWLSRHLYNYPSSPFHSIVKTEGENVRASISKQLNWVSKHHNNNGHYLCASSPKLTRVAIARLLRALDWKCHVNFMWNWSETSAKYKTHHCMHYTCLNVKINAIVVSIWSLNVS